MALGQLFTSQIIKEKILFSKGRLFSFLQTNVVTHMGLLQNYSCNFLFLLQNTLLASGGGLSTVQTAS